MPDEPNQETPGCRPQLRCSIAVALDHRHQGVVIVRASGEIDSASAPRLSAALHRELDTGRCRLLVVDLRAVDFLGAQGIVVLNNACQHAQACHIAFRLIAGKAVEAIGRNPEATPKIQTAMILGIVFTEGVGRRAPRSAARRRVGAADRPEGAPSQLRAGPGCRLSALYHGTDKDQCGRY